MPHPEATQHAAAPSQGLRLRDYQESTVVDLRATLREHRRTLLQLPTGGGKTAIASFIADETIRRGRRAYVICHRAELVEQTSLTWRKYGIPHGFIAADRPKVASLGMICSVDTLKNRLATTAPPDVAVWDEAHHLGAVGWQRVMDAWPDTLHIGLSATPIRMDGKGLGRQFGAMVNGPPPAWLIENGFLSQYEIYAPNPPDMKGARRVAGDYSSAEASARMDVPKRIGDIIVHWRTHAEGMRTVAFAVNRDDSRMIVDRFNANRIPFAHLDGETPKGERKDTIGAFAAGELVGLSNVALFGEGFDLAAIAQTDVTIDCLIDAAPTQSLPAVMQRWGRVLRPKDFPAIILDHAGNSNRHGFPDDEREWSLEDRERSGRGGKADPNAPPPPYTCKCFRQLRRPLPAKCPHCEAPTASAAAPVTEDESGELIRRTAADKAAVRQRLRLEEHNAKSLSELAELARRRGYASPNQWAFKKWSNSAVRQRHAKRISDQAAKAAAHEGDF